MARVEKMELCTGNISFKEFSTLHREDSIVLTPRDQRRGLMKPIPKVIPPRSRVRLVRFLHCVRTWDANFEWDVRGFWSVSKEAKAAIRSILKEVRSRNRNARALKQIGPGPRYS